MKTIIQTPTPDIEKSIDFYKKLGFTFLSDKDPVMVSDGKMLIKITQNHFARLGIKLFQKSWKKEIEKLEDLTSIFELENGYVVSDVSGTLFHLIESDQEINLPEQKDTYLGNYMGLGIETIDLERSAEIIKVLGFKLVMPEYNVYGRHDGTNLALYKPNQCPHLFINPSLTFFNGKKNLEIIQKLKELKINIIEEITVFNDEGNVDNVIVQDPGGLSAFIFSD